MIKFHTLLIQIYTELLPTITDVAKQHGYSIAVHGSLTRDFDLIAVPWSNDVSHPVVLVDEIIKKLNIKKHNNDVHKRKEFKPHNRIAYDIHLGMGMYIDLSIIEAVRID